MVNRNKSVVLIWLYELIYIVAKVIPSAKQKADSLQIIATEPNMQLMC